MNNLIKVYRLLVVSGFAIAIVSLCGKVCVGCPSACQTCATYCVTCQPKIPDAYVIYARQDDGRTWGFDRVVGTESGAWQRLEQLKNRGIATFFQAFSKGGLLFTGRIR
jgi:hypothetical protein